MERVKVGQIVNTYGIRGELKLIPLTFDTNRFIPGTEYWIEGRSDPVQLERIRPFKNMMILSFNGYSDINQVLPFKGKYLLVDETALSELPEDMYYIHDLLGLKLFQHGHQIGILSNVIENSGNDIYVVESPEGGSFMIPAVKEFIKEVNLNEGTMTVELIEGMLDEI